MPDMWDYQDLPDEAKDGDGDSDSTMDVDGATEGTPDVLYPLRVLVTGSRDWTKRHEIERVMVEVQAARHGSQMTLIHGKCRTGADAMADEIARARGWEVIPVPAQWSEHGKAAGPLRNQHMIDEYRPNIGLVFNKNKSRGTADCTSRMTAFQRQHPEVLERIVMVESTE